MNESIIAFIIVLGVLIFFHEFGHFLLARLMGVGVLKFSLGFGPKIISKKIGFTEYCISLLPFGGFVKMVGEKPDAEIDPDQIPISFSHKHVVKRLAIVAAGPIFNFFLAILIFWGLFQFYGKLIVTPLVGSVQDGSPAFVSGLKKGDMITQVNGIPVASWDKMGAIISGSNGESLKISFTRNDSDHIIDILPEETIIKNLFGEDVKRYIIGISSGGSLFSKKLNIIQSFLESVHQVYYISKLTLLGLVKMIQGTVSAKDNLGGPIQIAKMAGDFYREGLPNFLSFMAFLSVSLAILNLFPIPVLDGGHILFFTIELITGRPVNLKAQEFAQMVGLTILLLLMGYAFYNDIMKLFIQQ